MPEKTITIPQNLFDKIRVALRIANKVFETHRFTGLDQNPMGIRDLVGSVSLVVERVGKNAMTTLRQHVYSALDIAIKENGYTNLLTDNPIMVGMDLMQYDAELGDPHVSADELVKHIEDYQKGVGL